MLKVAVGEFLNLSESIPVIDVRSPGEFQQGHIPGAYNIPIFSDDDRKIVGTLYKKSGRDTAIFAGLELVGPKLAELVKSARKLASDKKLLVHCWRGGLRSKNMAWLFELSGLSVTLLEGGYKAYRRYIRDNQAEYSNLIVLGGYTGSGKSEILGLLKKAGKQVIDLEGLANHKGSAFGHIGQLEQPTTEQFENDLFHGILKFTKHDPIWVEDESRAIGRVSIPEPFFLNMRLAPVLFVEIPFANRVNRLINEYALFDKKKLKDAVNRISKRLGGQNVKCACNAIDQDNFEEAATILLTYYDKAYLKGLSNRNAEFVKRINFDNLDFESILKEIVKHIQQS
ncbi:MAG: tRNA 2-selenouridine(34) synthase MnmH [Bacteroidales bacterium]|nr:tRNA 2-selenouridine(34) synthase MnmH [Bacteroidales bacterium]MCF8403408.1 tRNA 2-selenouridine(34) synthase MnmH [Bacteroidales bacterium]